MVVVFVGFCSLISSINSQMLISKTLCDQKTFWLFIIDKK